MAPAAWDLLSACDADERPHADIEVMVTDPAYRARLVGGMRWSTVRSGKS